MGGGVGVGRSGDAGWEGGSVAVGASGESNWARNASSVAAVVGPVSASTPVDVAVGEGVRVRVEGSSPALRPVRVGVADPGAETPHADRKAASTVAPALCKNWRRLANLLPEDTSTILPEAQCPVNHERVTVFLRYAYAGPDRAPALGEPQAVVTIPSPLRSPCPLMPPTVESRVYSAMHSMHVPLPFPHAGAIAQGRSASLPARGTQALRTSLISSEPEDTLSETRGHRRGGSVCSSWRNC